MQHRFHQDRLELKLVVNPHRGSEFEYQAEISAYSNKESTTNLRLYLYLGTREFVYNSPNCFDKNSFKTRTRLSIKVCQFWTYPKGIRRVTHTLNQVPKVTYKLELYVASAFYIGASNNTTNNQASN